MKKESLEVCDLSTSFEPCGLFDREIEHIINTDGMVQAQGMDGQDIARRDEEADEVWALCWVRVPKGPYPPDRDQTEGERRLLYHARIKLGNEEEG